MAKIFSYLKAYRLRMAAGLAIKFSGTIIDLLLPWILAHVIDEVVPLGEIPLIFLWGALMILCSVAAVATNIIANRMACYVARETTQAIRHDLFSKISYLSAKQVDELTVPSLVSRLTTDTYNLHHMIGMMQRLGVRAPILLFGGIMITLTLDPGLSLTLAALLPFMGIVIFYVSRKGVPLYTKQQQAVDRLVRIVRENSAGIRVIKALSKTDYEQERFSKYNQELVETETKAGTTMAVTNPLMSFFLNIGLILVILVGAWRVNAGLTQPGKIIAFLSYFTIILTAMLNITRIFVLYSKGSASAARVAEVLDLPDDLLPGEKDHLNSPWHISFDRVSFSYHKSENTLTDISFQLKKGQTLGIIGPTGCGKSTIIRLLMRLYDPNQGTIRINGENVQGIAPELLHTKFGVIFQNDALFADTILENIDFGRNLEPETIKKAASDAQAGEFIKDIPEGFHKQLSARGTNLSGGQRQRLLIARALAGDPEILILDDSSSALDYKTDAKLRKTLRRRYPDTTTIIIAQRISSIMHADLILVMESGNIIGNGTHEKLLASCPEYLEISRSQMGEGKNQSLIKLPKEVLNHDSK